MIIHFLFLSPQTLQDQSSKNPLKSSQVLDYTRNSVGPKHWCAEDCQHKIAWGTLNLSLGLYWTDWMDTLCKEGSRVEKIRGEKANTLYSRMNRMQFTIWLHLKRKTMDRNRIHWMLQYVKEGILFTLLTFGPNAPTF